MNKYEFITPCHFGMEAVLKREILDLGYEIIKTEDGRVTFAGDERAIARANIFIRSAERILILVGRIKACTYDELFEGIKALSWEQYIPENGKFWVKKANSVKSKLFSPSDIQRIAKKAIVERLKSKYNVSWFQESGNEYPIRISMYKDEAIIGIDTSGESLHMRGYRKFTTKAPITETLAAGLLMLTPWNKERILVDPFCGSGTFVIEAAMMAAGIAPGINRGFTAENWTNIINKKYWYAAADEAEEMMNSDIKTDIQGYDIDKEAIGMARKNAALAGVDHLIHFQQRPVSELSHPKKYGFIVTNPPYGERLEEKSALPELYRTFGERYRALDSWSAYVITSYENAENDMGIKATKNRKIYNGMIKTYYYQFIGPKPQRKQAYIEK